jgi:hypothetical protein
MSEEVTAKAINPTDMKEVKDLPSDAAALLVWREGMGFSPLTVVVSVASWEMNQKVLMDAGMKFDRERIYEFESPINHKGRRTTFYFSQVTSWAINVDTGIIPDVPED